jgi:hypothetical protein
VPQAPAPSTKSAWQQACACGPLWPHRVEIGTIALRHGLALLLLVHGLEVDLRQMHWPEAAALNQIGHIAPQVGINNLWARNAHDCAHLVVRNMANFKNSALFRLPPETPSCL